jgi:hypothetical protein
MPLRFNHMELSLPPGSLRLWRDDLVAFYGEVFGFGHRDIDLFEQPCLALQTDPDGGQFLLIVEHERHLFSPGFDHLGFLLDDFAAVDEKLAECRAWQARDPRVQIKLYDDLELPDTVTRAFYVKFGLPLWFDVQHVQYRPGRAPERTWHYGKTGR